MKRPTITFLVIANGKGISKRFVLPVAWLKGFAVLAAFSALIFSVATVDYFGLLMESAHLKRLKAENVRLENQFRLVEGKLASLEKGLERVRTFSTKLKMITNTDDPDRTLKLAVGPLTPPGKVIEEMEVSMDRRDPASIVAKEDAVFFSAPPLDSSKNEIAAQGRDYSSLSIRIDEASKDAELREQGVLELWESLAGRESLMSSTPSMVPVRGWFTSRFGYRVSPYSGRAVMHQGLDVAAAPGTPVYAPADGIISFAGYDSGYGKLVSIDHGYGVVTRYGHNSKIYVNVGQKIKRGELLSAVGSTGQSTGPHLHYEVRLNNVPVDPSNYILEE